MLDLAPETENRLQEYAAREGVSADEAINRLLGFTQSARIPYPPLVNNTTDDQKRAAVLALAKMPREEIAHLNAPSIARLREQLAAAEKATPDEIAQANAEWEAHKMAMNENRRVTGERLLYPEEPQP